MKNKNLTIAASLLTSGVLFSGCANEVNAPQTGNTPTDSAAIKNEPASATNSESRNVDTNDSLSIGADSTDTTSDTKITPPPGTAITGTKSDTPSEMTAFESGTKYQPGSYADTGAYTSPGGPESIKVTVTLDNDVITDVTVVPLATKDISQKLQARFAEGIGSLVIGKKIEDITDIGAVNGSSLTGKGFQDALEKIKLNAKQI